MGKNEFHLNEQTRFYDVQVQELVERLKNIKDGSEILFKATIKDGKDIIIGIKPTLAPSGSISTRYWTYVGERLAAIGVTPKQVQVVWIKQADAGPAQGSPDYAKTLQSELSRIVRILPRRFPNIRLAYISSRTFGGYERTSLDPEPYAYESGFSVKWLIEQQINGDPSLNYDPIKGQVRAPCLIWGRISGKRFNARDF